MTARRVDGHDVLLVRLNGVVYAYENRCAHLGVALSEGRLDGSVLTCRAHHWQYDVRSGAGINPATACLRCFAVKIEDGTVFVDVHAPSPDRARRMSTASVETSNLFPPNIHSQTEPGGWPARYGIWRIRRRRKLHRQK